LLFIVVLLFFYFAGLVPLAILAIVAMDMNLDSGSGHIFTLQGQHTLEVRPQFIFFSYLRSSSAEFIVISAVSVFVFWQTSCTAICEMKLTAHWSGNGHQLHSLPFPWSPVYPAGLDWPVSKAQFACRLPQTICHAPASIMNIYEDLKNIFFASVVL